MHANLRYVNLARVGLILGFVLLALPARAKAELVAPTQSDALLAVAPDGTPRVAYMSRRDVVVARRTTAGWRFARAGRVPGTGPVLAGLVVDGRGRTSVLLEGQTGDWLALAARGRKLRVVARPRRGASFGPAGLTLDAAGRPAFAYALRLASAKTYLRLVTSDARGRLRTRGITKGGFPSSEFVPGAAPVLVRGRLHVVETYTDAAIDWGPKSGGGWEGQFLFASESGTPAGRVASAASSSGLWSAWTEVAGETLAVLLNLSADTQSTATALDHGIFVSLLVDAGNAEIGANDWAMLGDAPVFAGVLADANGPFAEVGGRLDGYARAAGGGRQLLLSTPNGLEWFASPTRPAIRLSITADASGLVRGRVDGAATGAVQIYRDTGGSRSLAGTATLAPDGTFRFQDTAPTSPTLYRAVYVEAGTAIPYAALLRAAVG
jgi:hypothetical protein